MVKSLLVILFAVCSLCSNAQEPNHTYSYGCTAVNSSMGPQGPPDIACWIDFYDRYIMWGSVDKYVYSNTNYDGSIVYLPTTYQDPIMKIEKIVFSKDYSQVMMLQSSSSMGMTLYIQYIYSFIGNGRQPALDW